MNNNKANPFAGETVLVVDDEAVIAELSSLLLKRSGFNVLTASNGQECLSLVEEHRPSLVLLDYMMPVMNGLDALRQIQKHYPDTWVIVFTGKGSEEVAVESMKAGAADYLQKPLVNENLLGRIENVLNRRKAEIENRRLVEERDVLQREIKEWNKELEKRVHQKSCELEVAHKEIIQSEKLAAFGHVAAGMAHEIRNPLNSINLFAQVLLSDSQINADNRDYIKKITHEVERIDNILIQMLDSSRSQEKVRQLLDIDTVLDKVVQSIRPTVDAQSVQLVLDLQDRIPQLEADPVEMEQIFTNLIGNALYEMPNGGRLQVSLSSDDEKITIKVADSGQGIPQENFQRIFDPFFTTRSKGTGFGLSVVLRIVNSCGGQIRVASAPGEGAEFTVELPFPVE